ncbi:TetR/AcrR family transcriptional regulator [Saccharopolyspora pogona]|uniref:TetR/AcrR family transcriptional regulator n=1 Tax=Saccharopolyspora pogona TaxID=333966 RepID=UPI001689B3D3|nr:TetR/AcrR family transcriptional regulator [Saccharopolyspora pogona]
MAESSSPGDQPKTARPEEQLTAQGARRRTALLDAAERVLTEVGNAESSMRAIAAEAGVRIGHLQHYFPSRAALIRCVLERALQRSLQRLVDTTGLAVGEESAAGPQAHPSAVVAALLAEHDDPLLVQLYVEIWAIAARDEEIAQVVRDFYDKYTGHVAAFIRHCQPDLPEPQRQAKAQTFAALIEGAALLRSGIAGHRSDLADAELTRTAIALLIE